MNPFGQTADGYNAQKTAFAVYTDLWTRTVYITHNFRMYFI